MQHTFIDYREHRSSSSKPFVIEQSMNMSHQTMRQDNSDCLSVASICWLFIEVFLPMSRSNLFSVQIWRRKKRFIRDILAFSNYCVLRNLTRSTLLIGCATHQSSHTLISVMNLFKPCKSFSKESEREREKKQVGWSMSSPKENEFWFFRRL